MNDDTITAISTPPGTGAIAMIRLSGSRAVEIADKVFISPAGKQLKDQSPNTLHFGSISDGDELIDEVVAGIYKAPYSYTGENMVEISCHGSPYIQKRLLELLVSRGARLAKAGEFTLRAFLNKKIDLTQVEAIADLIASGSKAAHDVAINQMRGGFTNELKELRNKLLHFITLIELELDFSEEDVEFADRKKLNSLLKDINNVLNRLRESFALGRVIKNGIPVAIAGKTNSGKSTLLNLLLSEEKAIVSDIEGTTRDAIEDVISIRGVPFRLIDTAGLRHTEDEIEKLGIERTWQKIRQASIVIHLLDGKAEEHELVKETKALRETIGVLDKVFVLVVNKTDMISKTKLEKLVQELKQITGEKDFVIGMSAKHGINLNKLEDSLLGASGAGMADESSVIITNIRHYEALYKALESLNRAAEGLNASIATDLVAQDIRETLHYLGEITGEITDQEILSNIFKNFCIGK